MLGKVNFFKPFSTNLFLKIYRLTPVEMRRNFNVLLIFMLLLACIETLTVGLIAFYAAAVSDPLSTLKLPSLIWLESVPFIERLLSSPTAMIASLSFLIIIGVPLKNAFRGWVTYRIARYSASMEAIFGQRLLSGVLSRDYRWHLQQNSADLIQTINWRHHLGRNFVRPYLNVICESFILLVLLLGLLLIQPVVSIIFIFLQGSAGFFVYRALKNGLDKSASECRTSELGMNRHVTRSIHGVKDVKVTDTSSYFIQGFKSEAQRFSSYFGRQQFWEESPLLALETLGFILISGSILFMLFVLGFSPLETTGTTALLAVTSWRTLPAFNRIVSSLTGIRTFRPYVLSLLEVLQSTPSPETNVFEKKDFNIQFESEIKIEKIHFSYEGNVPVLSNLSISIPKGKSIGIMGASGCGKSTFVDILTGLLAHQKGQIMVDDVLLSGDLLPAWRRRIGYVPQFSYIYDGTLAENIAFGVAPNQIDEDQVMRVCELAAVDFLLQLPQGIQTHIGERGVRLSGGQRQRVAIARALYRQPELIVFDEATSALDEDNDLKIRELIKKLRGNHTFVVVSHRKSTLETCDSIYYL